MPCEWTQTSGSAVAARDTTSPPHSGAASLRFLDLVGDGEVTVRSSCITLAERTAAEAASVWYRGTGPAAFLIWFRIIRYSTATCSGFLPYSSIGLTPSASWQEQSFSQHDSLRTAGSYLIEFSTDCWDAKPVVCDGLFDFYVDDVALVPLPSTAVTVASFVVKRTASGVRFKWRTSSEVETLGFHVYRQQKGKLTRLNRALIASVFGGTATGHAYSWLDRNAPRGNRKLRYRLQAVNLDGTRRWVSAAATAG